VATDDSPWFEVIGKALAFLCMQEAAKSDSKRFSDLPAKVRFLESIGLPTKDAAELLGTTANSVKTNLRQRERNKGNGKNAKKRSR
jgi:hypothetical protein